jgi:catechol 2,3-dioxygenase-like lactoylglutathione lyase family enzyme
VKVRNMDHIAINVRDVDASLRFYSDVLGLESLRVAEYRRGEVPFVSVRVSQETIIDLFAKPSVGSGDNADHFCLMIDEPDMKGLSKDLKARGVEVAQDVIRRWGAQGMGLSIYVKDPDGNTVELKSSTPA